MRSSKKKVLFRHEYIKTTARCLHVADITERIIASVVILAKIVEFKDFDKPGQLASWADPVPAFMITLISLLLDAQLNTDQGISGGC